MTDDFGGRGWIRTTEVTDDRFTVCSLWPLGNPSVLLCCIAGFWSWWLESNPQPADYKSAALPVELHQQRKTWCLGAESNHRHMDFQSIALPAELPRHIKFFWKCLYIYKHFHLATRKGLEPSTSSVTGWRTNQLYYRAKYIWFKGS